MELLKALKLCKRYGRIDRLMQACFYMCGGEKISRYLIANVHKSVNEILKRRYANIKLKQQY